jgi:hypothetical protein
MEVSMDKNMNSAWLAVGAAAALAAAGEWRRRRGGMNEDVDGGDDYEEVEVQIVTPTALARRPQTGMRMAGAQGAALQARRRAELDLPDRQLSRRIFSDEMPDEAVLGEMSFEQATNEDPRRIDALISRRVGQAFMDAGLRPARGGSMESTLYLEGMHLAREGALGQPLSVKDLVAMVERNMDRAMFSTLPMLPPHVKDMFRRGLPELRRGFNEAAQIATRAAQSSDDYEDSLEWTALADYLRGHPDQIQIALAGALPGPVGRGALPGPGGRRMLPPPRGGRNAGGRTMGKCGCRSGRCSIHR